MYSFMYSRWYASRSNFPEEGFRETLGASSPEPDGTFFLKSRDPEEAPTTVTVELLSPAHAHPSLVQCRSPQSLHFGFSIVKSLQFSLNLSTTFFWTTTPPQRRPSRLSRPYPKRAAGASSQVSRVSLGGGPKSAPLPPYQPPPQNPQNRISRATGPLLYNGSHTETGPL